MSNHNHNHNHNHSEQLVNGMPTCDIEQHTNTEFVVRDDILSKTKELAELLTTSREVQFFQLAEKQIAGNDSIQKLISAIKKKQKEIVAFESFQNKKMVDKIEGEIELLQDELDSIPIVGEFQQSQEDINYLLQLIMGVIRDTISDKITVESAAPETEESGYGE